MTKATTTTTRTPTIYMAKRGGLLIGPRVITTILRNKDTVKKKRRTKKSRFMEAAFINYMMINIVVALAIEAKKHSTGSLPVVIDLDVVKNVGVRTPSKDVSLPIHQLLSSFDYVEM